MLCFVNILILTSDITVYLSTQIVKENTKKEIKILKKKIETMWKRKIKALYSCSVP